MRNFKNTSPSGLPRVSIAVFGMFLAIALLNLGQTSVTQWAPRPDIECDNGEPVHRYAEVNATRVNIRDLPTVFSNVLTQKSAPDRITVVCEFGVWSRIDLLDVGNETWISMGLITLVAEQPLAPRINRQEPRFKSSTGSQMGRGEYHRPARCSATQRSR